jgi:hypothetical protein
MRKVALYLAGGTPVVVVLYPKKRIATVHRPNADVETLSEHDTLDLSDVVPGFSVVLTDIFS